MNKHLIATALAAAFLGAPLAATASEAELLARIDKMAAELEQLRAELKASTQKTAAVEQRQAQMAAAAPSPAAAPAPAAASGPSSNVNGPTTILGGYGEINYNRPTKDASGAQADVRRAVIAIEHRFDEKTKIVSEFEWEHAIVSADDKGESEVEQLYVEREFGNGLRSKVGLYLIPMGLLNTNHEPTAYYGVERNFVETAIIPSTWREVGVSLSGDTAGGLTWDTGITTGFDLGKWDAAGSDGRESPLGAIHQEVMVRHPLAPHRAGATLKLRNQALATSSNYYALRSHDGRQVVALVDGRNGEPVTGDISVSVRAPLCAVADALTKVVRLSADPRHPALARWQASAFII
jgi:hypothetical protein